MVGALSISTSVSAEILLDMNPEDLVELETDAAIGAVNHLLNFDLSSF